MSVPMVNRCCFCANLRTGTKIIGYLYSLWALFDLIVFSLLVTFAPMGKNGVVSTHRKIFYITAATVSGVHLISSVLLIIADYKKLASLTLPWTIVTGILTALFFILGLTGISLVLQDTGHMLEVEAVFIILHLARACISVYCIVVVHSRHKQIMFEKDERRFTYSAAYRPVARQEQSEEKTGPIA